MVVAGLLHDILEDSNTSASDIEANFGATIAELVTKVTKK